MNSYPLMMLCTLRSYKFNSFDTIIDISGENVISLGKAMISLIHFEKLLILKYYRFKGSCKDSTKSFCVFFTHLLPMVTSHIIIVQYKNQEFNIGIIYVYSSVPF